jgi:cyclopropane-fatty-acyl-phospholipid synthase
MQATTPAGASAEAIQRHYDVGNDFYRLWLDESMCYSCALYEEGDTLERAQQRKIDYHVAQARAAGAGRVLDVGCGWGGLLRQLVCREGVGRAVGLTLSQQQADWVRALGLPNVEVRLESWADHHPPAPYDAVISIGAFEHFARPEWADAQKVAAYRAFFTRCHGFLAPGGRLSLQTIAYGSMDRQTGRTLPEHGFLLEEVFPETDLPTLGEIGRASDGLFTLETCRNDADDYRRTCRAWFERLLARKDEAAALAGDAAVRRFLRYLKLSAALFHYQWTHLLRLTFRRMDAARPPR